MLIGIYTDIHFQLKGLSRIIDTGIWIEQEFHRRGVEHVICLGDSLNTREEVAVVAQSACIDLKKRLAARWQCDEILGNHDINLKHDNKASSLDALEMHPNIRLHRGMDLIDLGEQHEFSACRYMLMMPYMEDQTSIVETVANLRNKNPHVLSKTTGFGHLAINGAVQITRYQTTFSGAIGPDAFKGMLRTFTGHFHVHQDMDHNVTYVGSPLQFNFGDAGDRRGVIIFDTETGKYEFVLNPHYDAFRIITSDKIAEVCQDPTYKDTFVTVIYDDVVTSEQFDQDREQLLAAGIVNAKKESVVERNLRSQDNIDVQVANTSNLVDLIPSFVKNVLSEDTTIDIDQCIKLGESVVRAVNAQHQEVDDTGAIFQADPFFFMAENFLGITDRQTINFNDMYNGIWIIDGENGAGKSTVLEGFSWTLFGETIRDDMKADDVINDQTGKACRTAIGFKNGYWIERWRKGRSLTHIDGTKVTTDHGVRVYRQEGNKFTYLSEYEKGESRISQEIINNLLGIDHKTFCKSVILGQNITSNFISANDADRRKMIEEMLGLERFSEYLEYIRNIKRENATAHDEQNSLQQLRSEQLDKIITEIKQIDGQIIGAEERKQEQITSLNTSIREQTKYKDQLIQTLEQVKAQMQPELDQQKGMMDTAQQKVDSFQEMFKYIQQSEAKRTEARTMYDPNGVFGTISTYQNTYSTNIAQAQAHINQLESTRTQLLQDIANIPHMEADEWQDRQIKIEQANKNIAEQDEMIQALLARRQDIANTCRYVDQKIAKLQTLHEGECPTCTTTLTSDGISKAVQSLCAEIEGPQKEAEKLSDQEETLRKSVAQVQNTIARLTQGMPTEADIKYRSDLNGKLAAVEQQIVQQKQHLENIASTSLQSLCDALGITFSDSITFESIKADYEKTYRDLMQEADRIMAQFDQDSYDAANNELRMYKQAYDQGMQRLQNAIDSVNRDVERNEGMLETMRVELAKVQKTDSATDLQQIKDRLSQQRAEAIAEIDKAKDALVLLNNQKSIITFWDKAFAAKGALRSYLLEDSVQSLNLIIDGYMSTLFPGISLVFGSDLTKQTKYGTKSGGQRKCLDLAVLFSVFELVIQRLRFKPHFMGLDEVFDGLDKKRQKTVQEVIGLLAQRMGKVFVISHADISGLSFTGSLYASMETLKDGTKWSIKHT